MVRFAANISLTILLLLFTHRAFSVGSIQRIGLPSPCMHTKWLLDYIKLHENIIDGHQPPRYLVIRPYSNCGLGNRLQSIAGALFFAAITQRALVIDWGFHFRRGKFLKDPPQKEGVYLEPHLINHSFEHFEHAVKFWESTNGSLVKTANICYQHCDKAKEDVVFAGLDNPNSFFKLDMTFDDIALPQTQVVYMEGWNSGRKFIEHLWAQPAALLAARRLGFTREETVGGPAAAGAPDAAAGSVWGGCALRILFRPSEKLSQTFCKEYRALLPNKKAPLIGIHIRTNDKFGEYSNIHNSTSGISSTINRFFQCGKGIMDQILELENDPLTFDLYQNLDEYEPATWLAGADKHNVVQLLQAAAGRHNVTVLANPDHYRVHSGRGSAEDPLGPMLDMQMLSSSLFSLGSYYSTFTCSVREFGIIPATQCQNFITPFAQLFKDSRELSKKKEVQFFEKSPYEACKMMAQESLVDLFHFLEYQKPFVTCSA